MGLFTKAQFEAGLPEDKLEEMRQLGAKYAWKSGMTHTEVLQLCDKLCIDLVVCELMPRHIIRLSSTIGENDVALTVSMLISPSKRASYYSEMAKIKYENVCDENLFQNIMTDVISWATTYWTMSRMQENVDALNAWIADEFEKAEIGYELKFVLADDNDIVDATDSSITFGLSPAQIQGLSEYPLFNEDDMRHERMIDATIAALKTVGAPIEVTKLKKLAFAKDFGLVSTQLVHKRLRKVYQRKLKYVKNGIGYVDVAPEKVDGKTIKSGSFCLIEAVTAKSDSGELSETTYTMHLSPFDKRTLDAVEMDWESEMKLA